MAIIGKVYNPFGMSSGGSGLASGFKYAQGLKDRETFARGFSNYVNATNDDQKRSALQEMASVDGQSAVNLYKNEQDLARQARQEQYNNELLDIERQRFEREGQITPYQQAVLDSQKEQRDWERANNGKMNEYQTWQKDEALRKEQEAKEKEKLLGDALYRYQTAPDEEARKAALAEVYRASPDFAKDILKKQKEQEKDEEKAWNTDTGRLWNIVYDPNAPEEQKQLALTILKAKGQDPYQKGQGAYETQVGKQQAESGMPYYGITQTQQAQEPVYTFGRTFGNEQQPMQAQPIQERQIPTAAQLAADKKRAEKEAEETIKKKENARLAKQSSDYLDDTIKFVEETPDDVFSPFADWYQKAGVITNGLLGFDSKEQAARGEIGRRIGIVQNDILAEARAKGQTGINTMSEIRQATKGIDENSGKPALLSALKLLRNIKERLAQMPDEEGYTEPQEEIIYYEDL